MDGPAQGSVCPQCGSTQTGSLFCKKCGATLHAAVPLIPSVPAQILPKLPIWKRTLHGLIKTIAAVAVIVFIFDNRASIVGITVILASVVVALLCFLIWSALDLGDDDWFRPAKGKS
jgi:uncharacterized membrane protein YvbJ